MKEFLKKNREIISYLFWGILTTIVSWGTYSLFEALFRTEAKITLSGFEISVAVFTANVLSWICAVLFAFITNKIFVFRSRSWKRKVFWPEFWKFVSARLATGIIEIIAVPFLEGIGLNQRIFGIEGIVAKIIVSVVVVILNYIFSRLFVFRSGKK